MERVQVSRRALDLRQDLVSFRMLGPGQAQLPMLRASLTLPRQLLKGK